MIQHNDAYTQKKEKQNPADIILLSLSYVYSGCHKVFFFLLLFQEQLDSQSVKHLTGSVSLSAVTLLCHYTIMTSQLKALCQLFLV